MAIVKKIVIAVVIVGLLAAAGAVWGGGVASWFRQLNEEDEELDTAYDFEFDDSFTDTQINFLVLGLDTGYRLADVIMLVTLDTGNRSARVLSIPRDTVAELPDGTKCKLNELYYLGGTRRDFAGNVEHITWRRPDFYIEVSFQGFINFINTLGGVEFELQHAIDKPWQDLRYGKNIDGAILEPGVHRVSGEEALAIVRDRSTPGSDFDRMINQQRFMLAVLEEVRDIDWQTTLKLVWVGLRNVKTNISFRNVVNMINAVESLDPER